MAWYEILMVSVGLSLDVFAYALYKGAMVSRIEVLKVAKMAVVFALWQEGAMLVGSLFSEIPVIQETYPGMAKLYQALAAVLFFVVGMIMIVKAVHGDEVTEHREDSFLAKQLCAWAAVTSIDSLMTGVGLGLLNTRITLLVLQLGIVTVITITAGIWIGYRLGCRMRSGAKLIGGIILLFAGFDVLFRYHG